MTLLYEPTLACSTNAVDRPLLYSNVAEAIRTASALGTSGLPMSLQRSMQLLFRLTPSQSLIVGVTDLVGSSSPVTTSA